MDLAMMTALANWRDLTTRLNDFNEGQVTEMLNYEVANRKRKMVAIRLHQRQCALRAERERGELLTKLFP